MVRTEPGRKPAKRRAVFPKVIRLMKEKGLDNVLLTGGGIIPDEDMAELNKMGRTR
jgi:methylmalonyl-CoA mutase C-terminal domain/subunit